MSLRAHSLIGREFTCGPSASTGSGFVITFQMLQPPKYISHGSFSNLGMAQGLKQDNLIEVDGGRETLFTRPAVVVEGFLKALKLP